MGAAPSVGHFATLEETLEGQTANELDSFPIESQAQDLNEKVAIEFQQAREKVEDWIETHVQCNYQVILLHLEIISLKLHLFSGTADFFFVNDGFQLPKKYFFLPPHFMYLLLTNSPRSVLLSS